MDDGRNKQYGKPKSHTNSSPFELSKVGIVIPATKWISLAPSKNSAFSTDPPTAAAVCVCML